VVDVAGNTVHFLASAHLNGIIQNPGPVLTVLQSRLLWNFTRKGQVEVAPVNIRAFEQVDLERFPGIGKEESMACALRRYGVTDSGFI
jgi:hypothetical protein